MIAEQYVNNAISSLTGAITNVATTLTVASATNFPTAGNFHILIDSEIMVVTVVSGTTFTVTRGQEGTTAAAHASGAQVINILTAASLQNLATNPIGNLNNQGQGMFLSINTEQNNSNAFIMGSGDGINWDVLRPLPAYKPPSGYLKDPSIYYDGTIYWMVYTMATNTTGSTTSTSWGIASSPDLINWTHVTDISEAATVASAAYVQGPEWFVDTDGSVHIFVCVGVANTNCSLFERHPTSSDMTAWSSPVAITGTSLHVGIESPYVVKVSGTYYIFVKTNTNFYIELMTSTSLTSGYVMSGVSHWMSNWPAALSTNQYSAPCFVQVSSTVYYMYVEIFDGSNNGLGMYYSVFNGTPGSGFLTGANYAAPVLCADPFIKRSGSVIRIQDIMTMRNALALTINSKRNLACYALSSGFSIPTGVATAITWIAQYDDAGFLSSTKFTVPLTGLYHLDFYLHWVSNATGNRLIEFRKNGTTLMNGSGWPSANSLNDTRHAVSALLQLNAGDYIEVMATQTSGSTIGATSQATFVITKIR